jgi:microcin C transport system permease protein
MVAYALRRILLIIATLFAIMVVNFVIVWAAPGGPVEQMQARSNHPTSVMQVRLRAA